MAQSSSDAATSKPSGPSIRKTSTYLVLYNQLSACLRIALLLRTVQLWSLYGQNTVWDELNAVARWAETLSALEIFHAAIGLVRASPATTALQVAGRNTIVWAITRNYPHVAAGELAYPLMLATWNAADAVRYLYFAVERGVGSGAVFNLLLWLRYNMFIVLYPIGILSEAKLVYEVIEPSKERNQMYQYLLWFGLSLYIPAFFILYGHMLSQRAKSRRKQKQAKAQD
ncbi:tyrosine phosphatase-like protein [Mariannaea sp. PMI_226]|nr:tyrosine phosphatase-like protein [Mariannaea sp. PMI_226]